MEYFDIESPEIKNRLIAENKHVFAFPTNIPIVPGHILICPKRHVSKIEELKEEEIMAIIELQNKLKNAMVKAFDAEGFNYAWNDGRIAGQNVKHFHLHMLPRKKNDSGVFEYEPRKFLYRPGERSISQEQELIKVAKLIQKNL